ncbi:MAG: WGR domain-containing protein [Proteobacteria bacterium]|nr:WGR domain-containing protein [Pseudomonadota bacterium]
MSEWTVHLEFEEGTSSKFWRARVEGKTLYVNYGKIGSNGQTQVKDFPSPAGAEKEFDKLVAEKRKKGYADVGGGEAAAEGEDEEKDEDEDEEGEEEAEEEEDDDAPKKKKKSIGGTAAAAPAPPAKAAAKPAGHRMVLEAGNRKVEAVLVLDGKTVRMDSSETFASPEVAKKAYERLKKTLAGEGYKD